MQGLKGVFQALNLINQEELENTYANQIGGDVWDLRIKGLTQKLEKPELVRVLTHIAKHPASNHLAKPKKKKMMKEEKSSLPSRQIKKIKS